MLLYWAVGRYATHLLWRICELLHRGIYSVLLLLGLNRVVIKVIRIWDSSETIDLNKGEIVDKIYFSENFFSYKLEFPILYFKDSVTSSFTKYSFPIWIAMYLSEETNKYLKYI